MAHELLSLHTGASCLPTENPTRLRVTLDLRVEGAQHSVGDDWHSFECREKTLTTALVAYGEQT